MHLLTIVILTYNEEKNIRECISSCNGIADRILVIDNFSNDRTVEIAKELGADVEQSELLARERIAYALSGGIINTDWILFLDADERMTPESAQEFIGICRKYRNNPDITGIVVKYRLHFMGKDLKHGGFSPLKKLRAFKPGSAYYENADVDEHYILTIGKAVYMKNEFLHFDYKGIKPWVDKHTVYAQRAAVDYVKKIEESETVNYHGLETSAKIKRMLKYKIYYKLPMGVRAWMFYFYCYYLRLGFLDGKEGKIYAFLHSYWYRFLVDTFIYSDELVDQAGNKYEHVSLNRDLVN